jgi:spore germination protein YaaH
MGTLRHALLAAAVVGTTLVPGAARAATDIHPLTQDALTRRLDAEVMAYLPYWELTDATVRTIDYRRLTTLAFFSVGMDGDGHLVRSAPGFAALMSDRATAVIAAAHRAGVRTIVSFSSFGLAKNAAFFSDPVAQATFVDEAAELVAARGLDGADLDVELLPGASIDAYATTAGTLAARLRNTNAIAFTSVATAAGLNGDEMAAAALSHGVGYAFLMGYDYRNNGSAVAGSIGPLARDDGGLSLSGSLDNYAAAGVPLDRVILGLPLYGRTWPTIDGSLRAPVVAGGSGDVFRIRQLSQLRAAGTVIGEDVDAAESSARLVYTVGGQVWQAYYDSPATLELKLGLVGGRRLAGAGFWALGYDRDPAYWNVIGRAFGGPDDTIQALDGDARPDGVSSVGGRR